MKNFKQYNESIRDLLKSKSDEEILKSLKGLSDNEKIYNIILYQLDFNLLPRDSEGYCIYYGTLGSKDIHHYWDFDWDNAKIYELPEKFIVKGGLDCDNKNLTILPKYLRVEGNLSLLNNNIYELPDNLYVGGHLLVSENNLTKLPKGLIVKGNLIAFHNKVELKLPDDAIIGGYVSL